METIASYLHASEESLLSPETRKDRSRVERLLAEDFLEFGSSGRIWTRDQIFDLLEIETYAPLQMKDFNCTLLAEGVALLTYRAVREDGNGGSSTLRSSLWTNRSGEWRLRFHQGTRTA